MGIHSTLNLSLDENFTLDPFIKYVATVYHFEVIQFINQMLMLIVHCMAYRLYGIQCTINISIPHTVCGTIDHFQIRFHQSQTTVLKTLLCVKLLCLGTEFSTDVGHTSTWCWSTA